MKIDEAIGDKDIHIHLLKETLTDLRTENKFVKKTVIILFLMLFFAIAGIVGQGMYYQHRLFKFIGETEFTTEIHMDSEKNNYNNMNVERK